MAHLVYLALGSNLGNRLNFLQSALNNLTLELTRIQVSSVYESDPWGYADQGKFLNMVISAETFLSPLKLLNVLKKIEIDVGRNPTFKNGPREIDIDIILYGNEIIHEENLKIPHPEFANRAFVIKPLAELNADQIDPKSGKSFSSLLNEIDASQVKIKKTLEIDIEAIKNSK